MLSRSVFNCADVSSFAGFFYFLVFLRLFSVAVVNNSGCVFRLSVSGNARVFLQSKVFTSLEFPEDKLKSNIIMVWV